MQPTMKKVHSLDYASAQRSQHERGGNGSPAISGSASAAAASAGALPAQSLSKSSAPLMHSVSIVVELAKEPHPSGSIESESSEETTDLSQQSCIASTDDNRKPGRRVGKQTMASSSSIEGAHDYDGNKESGERDMDDDGDDGDDGEDELERNEDASKEQEEEDEEDDGGCLSSSLAQKVVIVDEADKILWTRAQSAEPRLMAGVSGPFDEASSAAGPDGGSERPLGSGEEVTEELARQFQAPLEPPPETGSPLANAESREPAQQPQRLAGTRGQWNTLSETTAVGQRQRQATCSQAGGGGSGGAGGASYSASSSELAERGDFSKLGMRRYTHHQVFSQAHLGAAQAAGAPAGPGTDGWPCCCCYAGACCCCPTCEPTTGTTARHSVTINHPLARGLVAPLSPSGGGGGSAAPTGWPSSAQLGADAAGAESHSLAQQQHRPQAAATGSGAETAGTGVCAFSVGPPLAQQQQQPMPATGNTQASSPSFLAACPNAATSCCNVKNWSRRRQSLQISLLSDSLSPSPSSSSSLSSHLTPHHFLPGKSLTEEELRGEREFNEQVRLAKSPESLHTHASSSPASASLSSSPSPAAAHRLHQHRFLHHLHHQHQHQHQYQHQHQHHHQLRQHSLHHHHYQPSSFGADGIVHSPSQATTAPSTQVGQAGARQLASTATSESILVNSPPSASLSASPSATVTSCSSKQADGNKTQQQLKQTKSSQKSKQQTNSHRRVSFSSIDPVLVYAADKTRSRASIAFPPTSSAAYSEVPFLDQRSNDPKNNNKLCSASSSSDVLARSHSASHTPLLPIAANYLKQKQFQLRQLQHNINRNKPPSHQGSPTSELQAEFSLGTTTSAAAATTTTSTTVERPESSGNRALVGQETIAATSPARHFGAGSSSSSTRLKRHSLATTHNLAPAYTETLVPQAPLSSGAAATSSGKLEGRKSADSIKGAHYKDGKSDKTLPGLRDNKKREKGDEGGEQQQRQHVKEVALVALVGHTKGERRIELMTSPLAKTGLQLGSEARNMNDNSGASPEPNDSSTRLELSGEPQKFSTKLEGQDIEDDLKVTSTNTIISPSVGASAEENDNKIQSIMASAKLRQEEFARLLEEHQQIVKEIHRVETKISSSQTSLQQQQQPGSKE